ncbi:acetylornithine and succinylornithine aminotransferase [Ascobolus immersus RN42]|uniref:acetylornithine transaminase n=1 Tax=Ascobolus immersus RN42 TaxID=1160509 RepID=A0A3N4IZM6_ASCIM|nr:acetylornithine and succinylornithine aminotransferase [Ascobolus immersus RN42]
MSVRAFLPSARAAIRPVAASSGTAAYSSAASNLDTTKIDRDAKLACPDPSADSASGRLTAAHLPRMVPTYSRPTPVFTKGLNAKLWDLENREYIDLTAGIAVNSLGHSDPGYLRVLSAQASELIHCSNLYHNPWTGELSKLLVEKTVASGAMKGASRVFVCNSGSEANEAAIKFSRKLGKLRDPSGKKFEIVSFNNSFHGRTMGSLSATPNPKYQAPFAPMVPGFKVGNLNKIDELESLVTEATCGVIVEPIQGEGGIFPASPEFLQALRKRCTEVGALLIYDEIQCGLGRTGDLWAHQAAGPDAHPDILTMAKALGNGFPIGATMVTEEVALGMAVGDHGTTYGGNPLASRLGHYTFSRLSDPEFLKNVNAKGAVLREGLEKIQKKFAGLATGVRGRGLIQGLQMSVDPSPIVGKARERGLLVITAGGNTLRFVPPLTIEDDVLVKGLAILEEAIEEFAGEQKA